MSSAGPLDPKIAEVAKDIGRRIGDNLPDGFGFALLIFNVGENPGGGMMNYISNAKREEMISALKELIANFEGRKSGEVGHA
jgi:hypothetical protein